MKKDPSIELISPTKDPYTFNETTLDFTPKTFDEYLGQKELKEKLSIYATAARIRKEALDHVLLFGPSGLGKTTLAHILAHIMQVSIKICSGPMLERTGDLVAILSSLERKDILFIDEIHRMPITIEETLYAAMEQFRVDVIIGQGVGAQSVNLPLNPFTLIGATTKSGLISAPLRSRFGIIERLEFYDEETLTNIILQNAHFLQLAMQRPAAYLLAQAARGTPRIAKKLLRRIRDFAQVNNENEADANLVRNALTFLGINPEGLTKIDTMILKIIVCKYNGGPVGLETLSSLIGEDAHTLETVYEPFLIRKGYLEKSSRGRKIPPDTLITLKRQFLGQTTLL